MEKKTRKLACLLALLSRHGAIAILGRAEDGIRLGSGQDLPSGVTWRQYRSRIRELVQAGLIEKKGDTYFHTAFGRILYTKYIPQLEDAFASREES